MAGVGGSVSLEAAIRDKYCCSSEDDDGEDSSTILPANKLIKESAVYMRPGMNTDDDSKGMYAEFLIFNVYRSSQCRKGLQLYWRGVVYVT